MKIRLLVIFLIGSILLDVCGSSIEEARSRIKLKTLFTLQQFYDSTRNLFLDNGHEDAWHELEDGSDDQFTLRQNREAYNRFVIRPRYLRDVSRRDLKTKILGKQIQFPIGVGPSGFHGMFHPEGEVGTASAAAEAGTIFVLSCTSTFSPEEVMSKVPNGRKWMQVETDRVQTEALIRRVETLGFEALVLTIDSPVGGNSLWSRRVHAERSLNTTDSTEDIPQEPDVGLVDPSQTWNIIPWIRSKTKLPLIVKGIMTREDAIFACVTSRVDGIVVSNHGGRSLDFVSSTIDTLPEIIDAVKYRCEVYLDGGIRRGSDAFKALAIGAKMVFLGRGALWGLSVAGKNGTSRVLNILREEFDRTMALSGVNRVQDISPSQVKPYIPV